VQRKNEEKVMPALFFDSLPDETLDNVLRYFSRIPYAKNWQSHINVGHLVEAIGNGGVFGTKSISRFHTLLVSCTKNYNRDEARPAWKELAGPYLWTKDIKVAHAFALAGGGESLRTLVIGGGMYSRRRDGEDLIDDFVKHCPNVTSLSIEEGMDSVWVSKFTSQLKILEVRGAVRRNINEHYPALRMLRIRSYFGTQDLLRRIGASLESLAIHYFVVERDDDVDKIKLYCPNLKSVSLGWLSSGHNPAVSRLLASYGCNLEYSHLHCIGEDGIRDVVTACPNARFHLSDGYGYPLSLSSMNIIGPRLESLTLGYTDAVGIGGDLVEWTRAWDKCVNLRHLKFKPRSADDIQAVFSTPKRHLVSIELTLIGGFDREDVKKVVQQCANGTKCVEKFIYSGSPYFIEVLAGFLQKNRSTLRYILLGGRFSSGNKKLENLLQSFLKLPALEELYVDYEIPEDILKILRSNGVYWSR